MKRPWQVWLLYGLSLVVALGALAWLTESALRLEQEESTTRVRAEHDERVRLALWRMDTWLMPLIAKEAAHSYYDYAPFYPPGRGAPETAMRRSPLLLAPSQYVLLNFQVAPSDGTWNGKWTSPQHPGDDQQQLALRHGATRQSIERGSQRLTELAATVGYQTLLATLPAETLQVAPAATVAVAAGNSAVQADPFQADAVPKQAATDDAPSKLGKKPDADFVKRKNINESNFQREFAQQRAGPAASPQPANVTEGLSRPVWSGEHLLLARRVTIDDQEVVQGCWLDWTALQRDLRAEVADLVDQFELRPIRDNIESDDTRSLAALPVQFVAAEMVDAPLALTPLRTSLVIAWIGLALAAVAIGASLAGVVALSQRRAAFVSAVTHELRTPLTTLRMYSEMLDENMVADEAAKKDYMHALRVESDRLAHLVENVLAYAGLERGRHDAARERVTLDELWNRLQSHLVERAQRSGMELVRPSNDGDGQVALWTDPAAIEQILFNLVDNAAKYASRASDRTINVQLTADDRNVKICVRDHGPGIAPDGARHLFRPFSKSAQQAANSAPGVGLGLALCRRLARQLGGDLRYEPPNGAGAVFAVILPRE